MRRARRGTRRNTASASRKSVPVTGSGRGSAVVIPTAVHGMFYSRCTSRDGSASAIRWGGATAMAAAPWADGCLVSRVTVGQWTDDEVANDPAHCA